MGKIAVVFAGQGAQEPGMGREIYDMSPAARQVFGLADKIRPGTSRQCFEGTPEELQVTANTQPCLFTVDLACAMALGERGVRAQGVAGFSLGELAAVAYSGLLTPEDAFRLVCRRGEYMEQCAAAVPGVMTAVLKLDADRVCELAAGCEDAYPVNFNCPTQTVVAARAETVGAFEAKVKAAGGRCIRLKVGGAFHTPYMEEASAKLYASMEGVTFNPPHVPVYANATGLPYDAGTARELLARQVKSPVQWTKTIQRMIDDGFDFFIEVGPGKTLTGLIGKIDGSVTAMNVEDAKTLAAVADRLEEIG